MNAKIRAGATADDGRVRQIVEGLRDGFLGLDADWRINECNGATERFLDSTREELIGRHFWDFSGTSPNSPFGDLARRVITSRTPEEAEVVYARRGHDRLLAVQVFPMGAGVAAVWRDVTEIRHAERRLAESEARYRELADGTPAASWLSGPDGKLEFINQAMADALGRPREELVGDGWIESIDPEDRAVMLERRQEARAEHRAFLAEGRFRRPDGSLRIISLYGRPRFDASGAFIGHVGMASDLTDARNAERRQSLLINELNHRVKNTLATVQSVIRYTLREAGVPRETETLLTERLIALSSAHDVLTRDDWSGAEIADIAREALEPYVDAGRIVLGGPSVRIDPNVAVALSMAFHELATNALKHGALSTDAGHVRLSWNNSGETVHLEWRESGGPPVTQPLTSGFGSRLLGRALAGDLGEPAELVYDPDGLTCRLSAPAAPHDGWAPTAAAGSSP